MRVIYSLIPLLPPQANAKSRRACEVQRRQLAAVAPELMSALPPYLHYLFFLAKCG